MIVLLTISVSNANNLDLKGDGVLIEVLDQNDEKVEYIISREVTQECRKVNGADPKMVWSGNYSNQKISAKCTKTFLTTAGKIAPISIAKGIETYGEVEVIDFIKKSQNNENLLLIDARLPDWYEQMTIPTAINISFKLFNPKHLEFEDTLETLGVEIEDGKYNFNEAKTLLIFCNGAWCLQSELAIRNLEKIGYPKDKLFWYRGGMNSWKMLNLTSIQP